jgi:V-type H+-transporting ATPase 16kDa proteolipid subunit
MSSTFYCSPISYFFATLGTTLSISLANLGAAYATAKSGAGIVSMGVMRQDLVMRSLIPVVMGGVLGIYGLITAVIINGKLDKIDQLSMYSGSGLFAAGLTVGLSSLAAGYAIGVVGDIGVRTNALASGKLFVGMILILIFSEAIGLYGLIVGLVVASGAVEKGNGLCTSYLGVTIPSSS